MDFGTPTGFRDQRGAAKDVAARDRARRLNNLTAAENTRLLARYAQLKDGPNGKKEGVQCQGGVATKQGICGMVGCRNNWAQSGCRTCGVRLCMWSCMNKHPCVETGERGYIEGVHVRDCMEGR